jgi:hypothetical protein
VVSLFGIARWPFGRRAVPEAAVREQWLVEHANRQLDQLVARAHTEVDRLAREHRAGRW